MYVWWWGGNLDKPKVPIYIACEIQKILEIQISRIFGKILFADEGNKAGANVVGKKVGISVVMLQFTQSTIELGT